MHAAGSRERATPFADGSPAPVEEPLCRLSSVAAGPGSCASVIQDVGRGLFEQDVGSYVKQWFTNRRPFLV
jgi:hypothetical protein